MRITTTVLLVLTTTAFTAVCTSASAGPAWWQELFKGPERPPHTAKGPTKEDAKKAAEDLGHKAAHEGAIGGAKEERGKDHDKTKKNATQPQPRPRIPIGEGPSPVEVQP